MTAIYVWGIVVLLCTLFAIPAIKHLNRDTERLESKLK